MIPEIDKSSFRDSSGFMFYHEGICYRQINPVFKECYDYFLESRLYKKFLNEKLLIPYETVSSSHLPFSRGYLDIRSEPIALISYPYEWCFTQFKKAALATLDILKHALDNNMILKGANTYNIQFNNGQPLLIDILSFKKYKEGGDLGGL